jgi:hypothetical protein
MLHDRPMGPPRARVTDPQTSHEAARSATALQYSAQVGVLHVLRTNGPLTDAALVDVYRRYARAGIVRPQSDSGIRSRRAELVASGRVLACGRVRLPSGRHAMRWVCAQ